MLKCVEVSNFKGFNDKVKFSLEQSKNYEFNSNNIVNGVVNKGVIYGKNGAGKSNLGLAIFDIVTNITDKTVANYYYGSYLNAECKTNTASFVFYFKFDGGNVAYEYEKSDFKKLVSERLKINDRIVIEYDRRLGIKANFSLAGTEQLRDEVGDSPVSIISYVRNNAILEDNDENALFHDFVNFVDKMLYFRSLEDNRYIGIENGARNICQDIVEHGNVADFQNFLNNAGIECSLIEVVNSEGKKTIAFDFGERKVPFFSIASTGTTSLALFYFWLQRMKDKDAVSFVFIDEFDAFYHHELSVAIVNELKKLDAQVLLTTHNTSIMSNELLRPDCYFIMKDNKVVTIADSTEKDIRSAHNLERMYKAGTFNHG